MLQTGAVLAGRYELGDRIGRGGTADVYRGHDRLLDRNVAVKVMAGHLTNDPAGLRRLEREARAAASLNHPNVVSAFDVVVDDGRVQAIVMELLSGRTLGDELATTGRMPIDRAVALADAIAAGLQAAHDVGLVHRDVKPSNVLLDDHGDPKLTDFGIARAIDSRTTTTGGVHGSVPYVAPEQIRGEAVDARGDLYALGCLLYHLLAGRPPFGGSTAEIVAAHLETAPPSLRGIRDDVPASLDRFVAQLLAKKPDGRPPDAATARAELGAAATPRTPTEVIGDVATRAIGATAAAFGTTPSASDPAGEDDGDTAPGLLALTRAAALGAVVMLAILALAAVGHGDAVASGATDAATLSARPVAPDPTPAASVEAVASTSAATPVERLRQLVMEGRDAGAASAKAVDELDKKISDYAAHADGHGRDGAKRLHELDKTIDELADKGEITPELRDQLDEVVASLQGGPDEDD